MELVGVVGAVRQKTILLTLAGMLAVFVIVLAASLFGILTRPLGFLAALWPANAILLGLMVRYPKLATPFGWSAAFIGYILADMATGGDFWITLWLTSANMAGAITGYMLFQLLAREDQELRRPLSVLFLFSVCAGAAAVSALVGGGAARLIFARDFVTGVEFWFVTEMVNNLIILPVMLTFPVSFFVWAWSVRTVRFFDLLPIIALIASLVASGVIGGPGAIAFPVPALLWCALSYGMFTTAGTTMLICSWLLIFVPIELTASLGHAEVLASTTSIRLGVALIALGPLTVASVNSARSELVRKLAYSANHDMLTGSLSRSAFMRRAADTLQRNENEVASALVLDLDHFKVVNDTYGHAAGDMVLQEFSRIVQGSIRSSDLFGRLGGEEFAILLANTAVSEGSEIANRLRKKFEATIMEIDNKSVSVTVSIGIAEKKMGDSLNELIARADAGLYRAKYRGRNTTAIAT